jgi:serine/alanine adding enzyme
VSELIGVHSGGHLPNDFPAPDVYFLPGYGQAAAIPDGGEWVLLEAHGGAWQAPLIVRDLTDGAKDAISPAYSGVYASASLSSDQVKEAWTAAVDSLRQLGVISVVVRQSPLVPQAADLSGLRAIATGRPTIVLEPTDRDSAWDGMEGRCRTSIRKALKNGYTPIVRQATGEDLAQGSDFRRLYEQTMQRRAADPLYFFGDSYYDALLKYLDPNLLIAEVRDQMGVVTSSSILMRHEHRIHGHLAASNLNDARMGSNNLLTWAVMQFAIDEGLRQYHIGGGLDLRDSLFKFKRSFGGRELEYGVLGQIIDHEGYRAHVEKRAKACDVTADALLTSDFFPAYRGGTIHA